MGEIESACVAPYVVLVINDNPYGLMFVLSYSSRFVHWHPLNSMCWIQGCMPSRSLIMMDIFDMIKKMKRYKVSLHGLASKGRFLITHGG